MSIHPCPWMDKEDVHIYNDILLSHEKEWLWISSSEVDEPRAHYTEWRNSSLFLNKPWRLCTCGLCLACSPLPYLHNPFLHVLQDFALGHFLSCLLWSPYLKLHTPVLLISLSLFCFILEPQSKHHLKHCAFKNTSVFCFSSQMSPSNVNSRMPGTFTLFI